MSVKITEECVEVKVTIHDIRDTWYQLNNDWNSSDFYDGCDEELDCLVDFDDEFDNRLREELGGKFDSIDYDDDDFVITLNGGYTLKDVEDDIQKVVDMSFGEIAEIDSFILVLSEDDGDQYQQIWTSCSNFEDRYHSITFYADTIEEDDEDQDDEPVSELEDEDNNFISLSPRAKPSKPAAPRRQEGEYRQHAREALAWLGKRFNVPTKVIEE